MAEHIVCKQSLTNLNWLSELLKLTLTPNPKPNLNPKYRTFEFEIADLRNSGLVLVVFGMGAAGGSVELSAFFVDLRDLI